MREAYAARAAEFVDSARRQHPGVEYQLGDVEGSAVDDASLGGVLAWFPLIHVPPDGINAVLTFLRRWLRPAAELRAQIESAGFVVTDVRTRADPGERPQGAISAAGAADRPLRNGWCRPDRGRHRSTIRCGSWSRCVPPGAGAVELGSGASVIRRGWPGGVTPDLLD